MDEMSESTILRDNHISICL